MRHSTSRTSADRHGNALGRATLEQTDDTQPMQQIQTKNFHNEAMDDIEHVHPYGFSSRPQVPDVMGGIKRAAETFLSFLGGNRSHGIGLVTGDRRFRLFNLKPGEVGLHDDQGLQIHLTRNGIVISTPHSKKIVMQVMQSDQLPQQSPGTTQSQTSGGGGQYGQTPQDGQSTVATLQKDKDQFTVNHPVQSTITAPQNKIVGTNLAQLTGALAQVVGTTESDVTAPTVNITGSSSVGISAPNVSINSGGSSIGIGASGPAIEGPLTVNGNPYYYSSPSAPQGRLTLSSGTPVMTSSVSGASTIYYTPYIGKFVPLWNGSQFVMTDIGSSDLSQTLSDTTKSPAATVANTCYDMFVWEDGGTVRCTRGPAWTTSSGAGVRANNVVRQNGLLVNQSAITNGPAAGFGTWVGTIATNANNLCDFIYGSAASGGGAATLYVWNYYNRVRVTTAVIDSGSSYTYSSSTIRQAGGSSGNQVNFVSGMAEDGSIQNYQWKGGVVTGGWATVGLRLNGTTGFSHSGLGELFGFSGGGTGSTISIGVPAQYGPFLGMQFIAAVEQSDGTNANVFNSNSLSAIDFSFPM